MKTLVTRAELENTLRIIATYQLPHHLVGRFEDDILHEIDRCGIQAFLAYSNDNSIKYYPDTEAMRKARNSFKDALKSEAIQGIELTNN